MKLEAEHAAATGQAAENLDVHPNTMSCWARQYRDDPNQAVPGGGRMKPEQTEIARLKKENARLKAERDILKKAAARVLRPRLLVWFDPPQTG